MSQKTDSVRHLPGSESEALAQLLRQRAEAIAREQGIESKEQLEGLSVEKLGRILHELYVHQIELEMQNEELRQMQIELDAARARYFDLYELAPSGYCTLDPRGVIAEANLTLANLLGLVRSSLVGRPISKFIFRDDEDVFYLLNKQLAKTGDTQVRELRLVKNDGTSFRVHLVASLGYTEDGTSEVRCMMTRLGDRSDPEDGLPVV